MDRTNSVPDDRSITPGFLGLDVADAPTGGRAEWLAAGLRSGIAGGHLPQGYRLPPSRVLATELGVSRGVVTEAYRRLGEAGYVAGRGRAGTVVVSAPATAADVPPSTRDAASPSPFAARPDAAIFDALRIAPARVDLTPGVPDLAAFPRAAWLRAERAVLGDLAPAALGYGDVRGTLALREAVAAWLGRNRGIVVDPDEVVIVAGIAQALGLLAQVLRDAGVSSIAVEDPGSLGVQQHLRSWGLATPPVAVDAHGLRVDELRAIAAPAVMMTPAHQFPLGVVLHPERRRHLRAWAEAGGLVIEDDYDAEHRYDRPPVAALRAGLPEQVCYLGSVSKMLAPAIRIGWALVPRRYRSAFVAAKRNADLGNAALPQLVLAGLMASGALERQLRLLKRRHVRRRNAMIDAIDRHLPASTRIHGAAAGLHLTITLDSHVDDAALAAAALAAGVKVHPLSWHRQRPGPPGLVLGYAAATVAEIEDGIATIAAARPRFMPRPRGHSTR